MIESLVNTFTKNSFLFSKKPSSGNSDFQETLVKYDQQINNNSTYEPFDYSNDQAQQQAYDSEQAYDSKQAYDSEEHLDSSECTEACESEKASSDKSPAQDPLAPFFTLLDKLGLSDTVVGKLRQLTTNPAKGISKQEISELIDSLKQALQNKQNILPKGLSGKVNEFIDKLNKLLNTTSQPGQNALPKELAAKVHFNKAAKDTSPQSMPAESLDSGQKSNLDRQIQVNNTKHAEMKEIAGQANNIRFKTTVDPRFSQEGSKNTQPLPHRQLQLNVVADNPQGQTQMKGDQQSASQGQSADFLKKMKNILDVKKSSGHSDEALSGELFKAQTNKAKPSFTQRLSGGNFLSQLMNKIQSMTKAGSTLSAAVDFKSAEFGDMKLAAEAHGTNLAVKISHIGLNGRIDILSLKNDIDIELRNLGFENIELDFGDATDQNSGHNAFEDEVDKRLSGEAVKLPGDQLADLREIDEWLKSVEKVI